MAILDHPSDRYILNVVHKRLVDQGATTELYLLHHLSQPELELLVRQEIDEPDPGRPIA